MLTYMLFDYIGLCSRELKTPIPFQRMTSETTWFIISLCLLQMVSPVLSGFEKVCTFETYRRGVHQQGACGDNLADMLGLVCRKFKRSGQTRSNKTFGK